MVWVQLNQSPEEIVLETTKKNGKEVIWYNPDSSETGYSIKEMHFYIKGQQDGINEPKTTIPLITSFVISGTLAALKGSQELAIVILSPIPRALIGSLTKGNMPADEKANGGEPMSQAAYVAGYKQSARMKKILHSIVGSVVGTVVGGIIELSRAVSDS